MILLTGLLTLFSVLRTPSFQELAGKLAADLLSKKFHTQIYLEKISISDLLYIQLQGLRVNDHQNYEMLRVDDMRLRIKALSFKNHIIRFDRLSLDSGGFFLQRYPGDSVLNLNRFLANFLPDSIADADSLPATYWTIYCNNLAINDFKFRYQIADRADTIKGINFENLSLEGVFIDMTDISVIGDSISAFVDHVAFKEQSGFELLNYSGDSRVSSSGIRVKDAQISTGQTSLDLDLDLLYNDWDKISDFLDSVTFNATIRSSLVTLSDVGYFAPELLVMDDPVMLSGMVKGPVSDFSATNLNINLGEFTEFDIDISMKGLPDIYSTYVRLDIRKLNTTPGDISDFNLPMENPNLILPDQLHRLGFTSIRGFFDGYYNNFRTDMNISSDAGDLMVKGGLSAGIDSGKFVFYGELLGKSIQLGELLESSELGTVDMEMELDGTGLTLDDLDMVINGWVENLEFKKYNYEKIVIGGHVVARSFDGRLMILDPMLNLDFSGLVDFNHEFPVFDFDVEIDNANLYQLNLADRSEDMNLAGHIEADFRGDDPDSFIGSISVKNLNYVEKTVKYHLDSLLLSRINYPGRSDSLKLRSDFVDGELVGNFDLRNLVDQLTNMILGRSEPYPDSRQEVNFHFRLKDISQVTSIFLPGIEVSPGMVITGRFDSEMGLLEVEGLTQDISVSGMKFKGIGFSGNTKAGDFNLDLAIDRIILQENDDGSYMGLDHFKAHFVAADDSINYAVGWNNNLPDTPNKGSFDGFVKVISGDNIMAGIYNAEANLNGNLWHLEDDNLITIDSTYISVKNFNIYKDEENFILDGTLSHRAEDTLNLYFEKWSLRNFNPFIEGLSMELEGSINGRFGIFRHGDIINIFAGINITDLSFNKVFFGDAEFHTRWLDAEQALALDLNIFSKGTIGTPHKILGLNGTYFPFDDVRNFDFDIIAQNLNIAVLEPLLSSFSSHVDGFASGKLTLDGTIDKPLLRGKLDLQRAEMKVDYLNVIYSFANEVVFKENLIQFNGLSVFDSHSNKALLSGGISHDYFKNMSLDLTINPDKFMAMDLNRYQNEYFYGRAFATGKVRIYGPFANLAIEVDASTDKGTNVFIPINYSVDVSQNDFIVFTNSIDSVQVLDSGQVLIEGVSLDINMNISRDADIEIFLPGNIGSLKANGAGNLRLGIDPQGYLTLNGSYVIQSGLFVFTLEQLVSRRFDILEGSRISWTGDIYDAEVGIVARYRLRTDLSGLGISLIDADAASQKVIVFTDVRMTGNLFNPELSFGITFPNMQDQLKQSVYAVLDTNDKGLMNQQAISLLVLGSFSSTGSGGSNPVNPAAIASSTLSNMLSQISNDFNVGINYMPGDQVSAEQLEVALSTQLLDDRLIIDGNFDVSGSNESSQKTSSIVGDINVEYKLSPDGRFRVKAFNRSNDLSLFNDYSPYTQGVGVFYRKEFNNLEELFRRSVVKQNKKDKN